MNMRFWNRPAPPPRSLAYPEENETQARLLTVCLANGGSYPHYKGGVSTGCDMLVRGLPEVNFTLVSLVADPGAQPAFALPDNVAGLIPVAPWTWSTREHRATRR